MPTPILGSFDFANTPTFNNAPLILGDGNTPSILQGLTSAIPTAGTAGRIYITTDTNLVFRDTGTAWVQLSNPIGVMKCLGSAPIAAVTGTSLIPLDNTPPLITEGTQVWSQAINCSYIGSSLLINANMVCEIGTASRNVIAAFFLDSTCIGVSSTRPAAASVPNLLTAHIEILSTALTHTISCRVGVSAAATWYINRQATAYFNGLYAANSYSIMEY